MSTTVEIRWGAVMPVEAGGSGRGPIGEGISGRGRGDSDPLLVDCSGAERHEDQEVVGEVEDGIEEVLR
jgi:hypothetical protein